MSALPNAVLSPLQHLINQALVYDPASRKRLATLAGHQLGVDVTTPPLQWTLTLTAAGEVALAPGLGAKADTLIRGNAVALAALAYNSDSSSLSRSDIDISGDQDLLVSLRDILQGLDIDWEAALAVLLGDTAAHMVGSAARQAHRWNRDASARSVSGLADYLRNETELVVGKKEAAPWFQAVRLLTADSDRLNARVQRLNARLDTLKD